jgi:hypothetical protein
LVSWEITPGVVIKEGIMTRRAFISAAVFATAAVLSLISAPLIAQGPSASEAELTASDGWSLDKHRTLAKIVQRQLGVKEGWQAPRTAWGHPDLTGAWTSDSVHGIPRERPAAQGTRMFVTEDEYKDRAKREEQTRQNAYNASGANTGGRDRALRGQTTFRLTSLIVSPANGRLPAITPFAETRRAPRDRGSFGEGPFNTFEDFTLYDRCITRGIVGSVMPVPYGNGNVILQTPDQFVISYEMIHDTRIVPVDGRHHLASSIRQYLGDSRGTWQGDTLVIETTNFTDRTGVQGGNGNGLRHSEAMRLTEHFTRISDDILLYDMTIDDPKTYTKPWTVAVPLISPPGFKPLPYECHEGNGAIKYIMSAERAEDRALEEDLKNGIVRKRRPVQGNIDDAPEP